MICENCDGTILDGQPYTVVAEAADDNEDDLYIHTDEEDCESDE